MSNNSATTRTILVTLVCTILFAIFWWSTSEGKINYRQISTSTVSTNDNEVIGVVTETPKIQKQQTETESITNFLDDENEEKLWASTPVLKHYRHKISPKQILGIRQCKPLGARFADAVAKWLNEIQHNHKIVHNDFTVFDEEEKKKDPLDFVAVTMEKERDLNFPVKRLIYSCESHRRGKFCGGMGDRFRGMVSSAFLALLSGRRYEIFHPVPVPLQQFLKPRFIDWIPRVRKGKNNNNNNKKSSTSSEYFYSTLHLPKSYKELDDHMQYDLPLNRMLMNLKTHKKFFPILSQGLLQPTQEDEDLRIQSNTPGFERYIFRDSLLKKRFTEKLNLPMQCNISCYFGCMYGLLFEPSPALEKELEKHLGKFDVSSSSTSTSSLAKLVIDTHKGKRNELIPVVGLQVRVGGSWASDFTAKEPFRTVPAAFPFIFEDVKYAQKLLVKTENSSPPWPVFVTSDSEKFVRLAEKELSLSKVFSISGDCFQHTDTQNVNEAIPEKYKHLAEKNAKHKRTAAYLCTLMNHVVLSACSILVMGQSGFADTAFWAARKTVPNELAGIGFFMDMTNNKIAWEHTLVYKDVDSLESPESPSPAISEKNRIVDVEKNKDWIVKFPFFEKKS